jgi:hypothetical protein
VNERIERVSDALQVAPHKGLAILCECGDIDCMEQLDVTQSEFERVRQDPTLFFVCTGHCASDVEVVVEHHDAYDVVRKAGEAANVARELESSG